MAKTNVPVGHDRHFPGAQIGPTETQRNIYRACPVEGSAKTGGIIPDRPDSLIDRARQANLQTKRCRRIVVWWSPTAVLLSRWSDHRCIWIPAGSSQPWSTEVQTPAPAETQRGAGRSRHRLDQRRNGQMIRRSTRPAGRGLPRRGLLQVSHAADPGPLPVVRDPSSERDAQSFCAPVPTLNLCRSAIASCSSGGSRRGNPRTFDVQV
jgi:hypothetical protein